MSESNSISSSNAMAIIPPVSYSSSGDSIADSDAEQKPMVGSQNGSGSQEVGSIVDVSV